MMQQAVAYLIFALLVCAGASQEQTQEEEHPDLTDEQWDQLDALYTHFARAAGRETGRNQDWFKSSDPCEWQSITCKDGGRMKIFVFIGSPDHFKSSTPVTHALSNVDDLALGIEKHYPELDLAYIARLFPKLEELHIFSGDVVESLANLEALQDLPLKDLGIYDIFEVTTESLPLAEWLPGMKHLRNFQLRGDLPRGEYSSFDLRGLIPPTLEWLHIDLWSDLRKVGPVILSDDVVTAREQPDGSVIHPLKLDFGPNSGFSAVEMECNTLDPDEREIEAERQRPDGIHPLTIRFHYRVADPAAYLAGQPISKFAVAQNKKAY